MTTALEPYRALLLALLAGSAPPHEFCDRFIGLFLQEKSPFEARVYALLDEVFCAAEMCTDDPDLLR